MIPSNRSSKDMYRGKRRFAALLLSWLLCLLTGCSFSRAWHRAGRTPTPTNEITGRWEGRWLSEANGHNDKLRAIITVGTNGTCHTRFHAKYRRIISFSYTVGLEVSRTNGLFHFTGEEDLGALAGGVYHYDGFASPDDFVATYKSKYDHGIFQMTRPGAARDRPLAKSKQLVVVTSEKWNATAGRLRRFARADTSDGWAPVGDAVPVVLGRNGLAWGRGLHGFAPIAGPVKREGDGRGPAGVFRLSSAFGFTGQNELEPVMLPYRQIVPGLECVDDPASAHYNEIVERARVSQMDWQSSERMIEYGGEYRFGITVNHNTDPRLPGFGSCIFLHVWKDARTTTSGCTAMAEEQIESLLYWLDPEYRPALVQLPETEYNKLRRKWKLPKIQ